MSNIHFHFEHPCTLTQRNKLKAFLIEKYNSTPRSKADIHVIFVSDEGLLDINRRFLGQDSFTDVITFDLSVTESHLLADIYISVERVRENAKNYGVRFSNELHRIIFHAFLHILGYDDSSPELKQQMTLLENQWLSEYQV